MKIYLVRHTAVDIPGVMCYGQTDVPLKETFEEEAQIVKTEVDKLSPDIVYSSPLSRCTKLASACGFGNAIPDNRLMELNFGEWEKKQWNEIDMSVWETDWINPPAPGGESFMQMYDRVSSFFEELKSRNYNSVLIFTHGGVISCARVYFKQADIKRAFELMPKYGEIVDFEHKTNIL
ncbi:alpha-ribazole phosphatase [Dysgonomonas hofstadii]|nr:alpha-ribazole phosphatase [Dysgonomonas hofstadii]